MIIAIELIRDGLEILKFLIEVREQLRENQKSCRRLCEREDDDVLKTKLQEFAGFGGALKGLVDLLSEIKEFVIEYLGTQNDSIFKNPQHFATLRRKNWLL